MLKIRFQLSGRKKRPFYKIVLVENNSRRDGPVIEYLGYYDPLKKYLNINKGKTILRIDQGAKLSEVVTNLLIKAGFILNKNKILFSYLEK
jgi:small subunit ribosomal protein S16